METSHWDLVGCLTPCAGGAGLYKLPGIPSHPRLPQMLLEEPQSVLGPWMAG